VTFELYLTATDGSTGRLSFDQALYRRVSHNVSTPAPSAASMTFVNMHNAFPGAVMYPASIHHPGYTQRKSGTAFEAETFSAVFQYPPGTTIQSYPGPQPQPIKAGQTFTLDGIVYTIVSAVFVAQRRVNHYGGNWQNVNRHKITIDKSIPAGPIWKDVWAYGQFKHPFTGTMAAGYHWQRRWYGGHTYNLTPVPQTQFTLTRANAKPFTFTITLGLPNTAEYEVAIRRVDKPQYPVQTPTSRIMDQTKLIAIRATSLNKPLAFKRPHTIIEMSITATDQLGTMVDTLSAEASRVVDVWDGAAFTRETSSSPAWIALDILRGVANGDPLPDNRIDLDKFKDYADWCKRTSPHGDEYYHVDMNLTDISTVFEKARGVLASGRATLTIRENKFSVIYEDFAALTVPVQLFTPQNSWGFSSVKTFAKTPHAMRCSFVDATNEYQLVAIDVYNDGYDETSATLIESLSFNYVTRYNQAWRDGRYFLAAGIQRPESFSLFTDVENLVCERGDLVKVAWDAGRIGGTPTRLTAVNSPSQLVLQEAVLMSAGKTYRLRIRNQDGTQEEIEIASQVDANTLDLAAPLAKAQPGDLVIFGEENLVTDEFIIKSVVPGQDLTAELVLVPVARVIDAADQGTIPDYEPPINNEDMIYPQDINWAGVDTELDYQGRIPVFTAVVRWEEVGSNLKYEVWVSDDGNDDYEYLATTDSKDSYAIYDLQNTLEEGYPAGTTIKVKIRPVNVMGNKLPLDQCAPIVFEAGYDDIPPGKPLFFSANPNRDTVKLQWLPPNDKDIGGYMLKYSSDRENPDWDRAVREVGLIPYNVFEVETNIRPGSYMLKTVDTSGNESSEYAVLQVPIDKVWNLNTIQTIIEEKAPNPRGGTYIQTELKDGTVRLEETGGPGTYRQFGAYVAKELIDLGAIYEAKVTVDAKVTSIEDIYIASWPRLSDIDPLAGSLHNDYDVIIQCRTASNNPAIAGWPRLSDVNPLAGGTEDWSGWMNITSLYLTARYIQVRAILVSINPRATPAVYGMQTTIEMPDRTEYGHDINCPAGGMQVTFDGGFKMAPGVSIAHHDQTDESEYFNVHNITTSGFDIEFFDGTGAGPARSVPGLFDYVARGYGLQVSKMMVAIEAGEEDKLELMAQAAAHRLQRDLLT
jgi:hypothetical protein